MATEWKALSKLFEKLAAKEGFEPVLGLAVSDPDWDPAKHPHGKHGYWAKKGEAVYHALDFLISGQAKHATYGGPGKQANASATEGGAVRVGGVEIHPPAGEHGTAKSVDYALKPGEAAYKVQTGTSDHVVVTHADNTATELIPTPEGEAPKVGKKYAAGEFQGKVLGNPTITTEELDHAQGTGYTQQIKGASVGTPIINSAALNNLPAGTVVRKRNAKYTHVWEDWTKQQDGSWTRTDAFKKATPTGTNKSAESLGAMVDGKKNTFVVHKAPAGAPAVKKAAAAAEPEPTPKAMLVGEQFEQVEHTFPDGSKGKFWVKVGTPAKDYTKGFTPDQFLAMKEKEEAGPQAAPEFSEGQKLAKGDIAALPVGTVVRTETPAPGGKAPMMWAEYMKDADGSFHRTGAKTGLNVGKKFDAKQIENLATAGGLSVKSLPGILVGPAKKAPAKKVAAKAAAKATVGPEHKIPEGDLPSSLEHIQNMPAGTELTVKTGSGNWYPFTKNSNGTWSRKGWDDQTSGVMWSAFGSKGNAVITKQAPTPAKKAAPVKKAAVKAAVPSVDNLSVNSSEHIENHQGTSDKFYESAVIQHADGSSWHLTRFGSTKPGAHVTVNVQPYPTLAEAKQAHASTIAMKLKGGYSDDPYEHMKPELAPSEYKQALLDKLGGMPAATVQAPAAEPKSPHSAGAKVGVDDLQGLPVGTVLDTHAPLAQVQHFIKADNGAWYNADDPTAGSFNVTVKAMATAGHLTIAAQPSSHTSSEDSPDVFEPPQGPVTVPGTSIELKPGQSLYQSAGNKSRWAIVENGHVVQVLDKNSGADSGLTKQGLWHWDQKLKNGKLQQVFDHGGNQINAPTTAQATAASTKTGGAKKFEVGTVVSSADEASQLPKGAQLVYQHGSQSTVWTKQPNGLWQADVTAQLSPSDMNWDKSAGTWKIHSLPTNYTSPPKPPAKKAAAKKAAPAKPAMTSPNSSYTLPSGKTLTPGPGEHILTPPENHPYAPSIGAWLLTSDGKVIPYNTEGTKITSYYSAKYYAPGGKKSVKSLVANGATLQASGVEKVQMDLPTGKSYKTFSNANDLLFYAKYDYSQVNYYKKTHVTQDISKKLDQLADPNDEKYAVLEKPETAQYFADAIATINEGREKFKGQLAASQKSAITKNLKPLNALMRMSLLAQRINEPGHQIDDQDKAELKEIAKINADSGYEWSDLSGGYSWLSTRMQQQEFMQSVSGLGFDPLHATHEQSMQYVSSKGAFNASGMTPEEAKAWMLLDLGAPNAPGSKEQFESAAGMRLKVAAVAANAKAVAAKKADLAPSAQQKAADKAKGAKVAADYATVAKMSERYEAPGGQSLQWNADTDSWSWQDPAGTTVSLDAAKAAELIKLEGWHPVGEPIGSPAAKQAAYLDANVPNWRSAASVTMVNNLGAAGAYSMPLGDRKAWLQAKLRGDQIAMYELSHNADTMSVTADHPGSPDSPAGKAARQAMSNYLVQQDWWHPGTSTEQWSEADLDSMGKALGLWDAAEQVDGQAPTSKVAKELIAAQWIGLHQNLPDPEQSALPVKSGPVTMTFHDGQATFDVQPGQLVVQSDPGAVVVLGDDNWWSMGSTYNEFGTMGYSGSAAYADKSTTYEQFLQSGFKDVTPKWAPQPDAAPGLKVAKPAGIDQTAWDAATGAEAGGAPLKSLIGDQYATMPDDDVALAIASLSSIGSGVQTKDRLLLASAPETIQRTAVWASNQSNPVARDVLKSILAKARGGEYITPETQTWTPPGGHAITIPPGAELRKYSGGYALFTGAKSAFSFNPNGDYLGPIPSYYLSDAKSGEKITESFANLTPQKASLEGFDFSQTAWDAVTEAESAPWTGDGPEAAAAYNFQQALTNIPNTALSEQYLALKAKIPTLPPGVKAALVTAAEQKNTDLLTALTWKIGKGFYAQQPTTQQHPLFDPNSSYANLIGNGLVSPGEIDDYWSPLQKKAFADDHGMDISTMWQDDQSIAISDKITEIQNAAEAQTVIPSAVVDPAKDLHLTYIGPAGGSHGAKKYTDQFGDLYVGKNHLDKQKPPVSDMMVDSETGANNIGQLFGFMCPTSFSMILNGKNTHLQKIMVDGKGQTLPNLQGTSPSDLNDAQVSNLMQSQVLNWLLSNHDGSGDNFLRGADGNSIGVIDLGQAGKHWHDDKLEVGYLPPENYGAQWYDQFFRDVQQGKMKRDRAELVAQQVLYKAYQVQTQNDAKFEELLRGMLKNRPKSYYPKAYPNEDALVAHVMDRKHSLVSDFEKLYKESWKKQGWDWQVNTSDFGKQVGDAHVNNGPQFAKAVKEGNAGGTALMVDSHGAIADESLVMTPMKAFDGGTTLLGFGKLCVGADKTVTAWLKERVEGPTIHLGSATTITPPGHDLPGINDFNSAIVAYSKTVGQHAPNGGKEHDGAYNSNTVATAQQAYDSMKTDLASVLDARKKDPTKPKTTGQPHFETLEQQDAWVTAAQLKLSQYETVKAAHDADTPVFPVDKPPPPDKAFKPVAYEPSEGLGEPGKLAEQWMAKDGSLFVRTADGGHYKVDSKGQKSWLSRTDFSAAVKKGDLEKLAIKDSSGTRAPEQWANPDTGDHYVRIPEDPHYWQLYDGTGNKVGDPVTKSDMDAQTSVDPDTWVYVGDVMEDASAETTTETGKTFKVSHRDAAMHTGEVNFKTGQLVEKKSQDSTEYQTGKEYVVEYGNVRIRYRPYTEHGVKKVQQGNLSFEIKNWDGSPGQIDDVIDTLHEMGVEISPADETSMQLTYWRHVTEMSQIDGSKNPAKIQSLKTKLAAKLKPGMTRQQELDAYKSAWAEVIGQDKVDSAPWLPKFNEWFGQTGGKPMWQRPDFTVPELRKAYGNGTMVPVQGSASEGDAMRVIQSAGLLPGEERVRILGALYHGASNGPDQNSAASIFCFTTQNRSTPPFSQNIGSRPYVFLLDPRDALRAANFANQQDNGSGKRINPKGSFDPAIFGYSGGTNELLIKDGVAVQYCCVATESQRQSLIAKLKAAGINEVRGKKVEEFVIGKEAYRAKMKEIWERVMTEYGAQQAQQVAASALAAVAVAA